jgi:very-short-patch-repair endonuclease
MTSNARLRALAARKTRQWLEGPEAVRAAEAIGADQDWVVSRRQLRHAGVPRWIVRREVKARRWCLRGRQTLTLHCGPLSTRARRWIAVLETSPRAALDGVTALQAAGMKNLSDETIEVVAPRGSRPTRRKGIRVRESRLFREQDVASTGVRRLLPSAATASAARWARSDRQAKLFVLMCIQQKLAPADALTQALERLPRGRRRAMLLEVVAAAAGGVHSLGELDVAEDLRRRGLPEPDRQVVRRRESGTQYLDCEFSAYDVVLEIDGAGHAEPSQRLADLLRDLTEVAGGRLVIRLPLEIYYLDRDAVLDRLEAVFAARGWVRGQAA